MCSFFGVTLPKKGLPCPGRRSRSAYLRRLTMGAKSSFSTISVSVLAVLLIGTLLTASCGSGGSNPSSVIAAGLTSSSPASAEATKAAAAASSVTIARAAPCPTLPNPPGCGAPNWFTLLSTSLMPPGGKDLFITFSAQVGLFTMGNNTATGTATTTFTSEGVGLRVRVLLDGVPVKVGTATSVNFDTIFRSTSATLGGIVSSVGVTCSPEVDTGPNAGVITCTATPTLSTTPSVLGTVLDETGVRSFSWIARDVGVGSHTIAVQGQFTATTVPAPSVLNSAAAVVGPRTLAVEQVMFDGN